MPRAGNIDDPSPAPVPVAGETATDTIVNGRRVWRRERRDDRTRTVFVAVSTAPIADGWHGGILGDVSVE